MLAVETEPLEAPVLEDQILAFVASQQQNDIRPSSLAAALEYELSVEEASQQLCGLLAAVGSTATFSFDDNNEMVFRFPSDVAEKARAYRRQQEWKYFWQDTGRVFWRGLQILTAFGLILSLLILSVAAVLAILAALLASHQNRHARSHLTVHLHSLFRSTRQILWLYALFGEEAGVGDPFLRELAYDTSLMCSICCGSPFSIWYWWRARQLRRRGWGLRRVDWSTWQSDRGDSPQRGLLSIAVEFLFGPSHDRDESNKWKRRAAYLSQQPKGVFLRELTPFVDHPPVQLVDASSETLPIVVYFGGKPLGDKFVFPELVSESAVYVSKDDENGMEDGSWWSILYAEDRSSHSRSTATTVSYWKEPMLRLTRLSRLHFLQCAGLGLLNLIGVLWLPQAPLPRFVMTFLLPVLTFYAGLFWCLVLGRYGVILLRNAWRKSRNQRRATLARILKEERATEDCT